MLLILRGSSDWDHPYQRFDSVFPSSQYSRTFSHFFAHFFHNFLFSPTWITSRLMLLSEYILYIHHHCDQSGWSLSITLFPVLENESLHPLALSLTSLYTLKHSSSTHLSTLHKSHKHSPHPQRTICFQCSLLCLKINHLYKCYCFKLDLWKTRKFCAFQPTILVVLVLWSADFYHFSQLLLSFEQ